MLNFFTSALIRYGAVALLGFMVLKQLDDYPPFSWFDSDKRIISRLEKELDACKLSNGELIIEKTDLENSIIKQNKSLEDLKAAGEAKQRRADREAGRLLSELEALENSLQSSSSNIKTCQDAIDYLVGIENE